MSSIINKPFSWANRIIQAVFRGSPNLITTSDLNRQIEALKREMYLLQESSGVIVSDFVGVPNYSSYSTPPLTVRVTLSYVYCRGIKFEFDIVNQQFDLTLGDAQPRGFMVYAKKSLVTYEDDFSKTISGAKFADGTTQPAADHYVYTDPELVVSYVPTPDADFTYPTVNGKEFICMLAVAGTPAKPATGYNNSPYYFKVFTVPMGEHLTGGSPMRYENNQFTLGHKEQPLPNDDIKECVRKLWSRQYSLEKRLFNETIYGEDGVITSFSVNGIQFAANRRFSKTYTTQLDNFGTCELAYNFHLIGNICFVAGHATFEKNTMEDPLSKVVNFTIGTDSNEMPFSLYYMDTACALIVQNRPDINPSEAFLNARGYIDRNKIAFAGIPANGVTFYWYGMYCFSARKFWDYSADDRYGYFNDMR